MFLYHMHIILAGCFTLLKQAARAVVILTLFSAVQYPLFSLFTGYWSILCYIDDLKSLANSLSKEFNYNFT